MLKFPPCLLPTSAPRRRIGQSRRGRSRRHRGRPGARPSPRRVPCRATPITLSEARSRLDRSRFSRPNAHFSAFFKIYKKIIFSRANSANFCQKIGKFWKILTSFLQILQNFSKFSEIRKIFAKFCRILPKCVDFEKC